MKLHTSWAACVSYAGSRAAISLFWRDGVYLVTQWATERSEIILMDRHRGGNWDLMQNCCWFSAVLTTHAHTPFIWCAVSSVYAHSQANGAFFLGNFDEYFILVLALCLRKRGTSILQNIPITFYSLGLLRYLILFFFHSVSSIRVVLFWLFGLLLGFLFIATQEKYIHLYYFEYILEYVWRSSFSMASSSQIFYFYFPFLVFFSNALSLFFLVLFLRFVEISLDKISLRLAFVTAGPRRTPREFTISQSTDW